MLRIWPIISYELVMEKVRVRDSEGLGLFKGLWLGYSKVKVTLKSKENFKLGLPLWCISVLYVGSLIKMQL